MPTKTGLKIIVEKPTAQKLEELKIKSWPIWTKEPSSFDWHYDEREICYFLEGDVTVATADGSWSRHFDIDPFVKHCLLNGLDDIGLTLQHVDEIRAFEAKHRTEQPWLFS